MKLGWKALAAGLISVAVATAAAARPAPAAVTKLAAMRKAADDLDEAADPAAYRRAWEATLRYAATLYPPGHPERLVIESELFTADYLQGRVKEALARADRLLPGLDAAGPAYREAATNLLNARGVALMALGRHGEARLVTAEVLARRRADYGTQPSSVVAAALSNHANAEQEFGNYDAAIDLARQAIAEAERLDPVPPNAAVWYSNLPVYLGRAGRLEEAIERARATATRLEALLPAGHPFLAMNQNTLAQLLLQIGRPAEAEASARRAVEIAEARLGRKVPTATYMQSLAQALIQQGRGEEGQAVAEAALAILEPALGAEAERTLTAREAVAAALAAQGHRQAALDLQRGIMAARARTLPIHHRDRLGGAERMALVALSLGALDEARTLQLEAQALRGEHVPADDLGRLAGDARLGAIEAMAGGAGVARAQAVAAAADARRHQLMAAGTHWSRHGLELRSIYSWAAVAAAAAGDPAAAFQFSQQAMATGVDTAVQAAAARRDVADPSLAARLRERQDIGLELERVMDRLLRAAARGAPSAELAAFEAERASLAGRLAQVTASLAASGAPLDADASQPLGLAAAQKLLRPGEALLLAHPTDGGLVVIAATRAQARVTLRPADARRIATLVERVRRGAEPGGEAFDFGASAELRRLLLPAEIAGLARRATLLVASSGALSSLPLALLVADPTPRPFGRARWLIRDHAIVTLPSVRALAGRPGGAAVPQAPSFIAFGAPQLDAAVPVGLADRSAAARRIADLPALPASAQELAALGAALDARAPQVFAGAAATEAAVRATDFRGARVVAFATHGLLAGELDGLDEPALVLTPTDADDGLLTASEIARLRLDIDWVLLSACNTAGGDGDGRGGLAGLGRAFLHAGARNLLASHWAVRDDAAAFLSTRTVRGVARGETAARALQRAMLKMLGGKGVPGGDHPGLWAPFVLVGR